MNSIFINSVLKFYKCLQLIFVDYNKFKTYLSQFQLNLVVFWAQEIPLFLKNNLLSRGRESYACCSTPLEIAVLWGVLHLYEGNLEKIRSEEQRQLHFSKMQFCCKRPSETVLLLCSNSFDRFFLVLLPFPINPSKGSPSRTNDQVGLQVAVSGFSLESTRLTRKSVFKRRLKIYLLLLGWNRFKNTPSQ